MPNLFAAHADSLMPKYLVQKDGLVLPSNTYFVVRSSDVFAPPALHAYAGVINGTLEVEDVLEGELFSKEERDRLHTLADIITSVAIDWQLRSNSKVPD